MGQPMVVHVGRIKRRGTAEDWQRCEGWQGGSLILCVSDQSHEIRNCESKSGYNPRLPHTPSLPRTSQLSDKLTAESGIGNSIHKITHCHARVQLVCAQTTTPPHSQQQHSRASCAAGTTNKYCPARMLTVCMQQQHTASRGLISGLTPHKATPHPAVLHAVHLRSPT
jgi:hypothetical protein